MGLFMCLLATLNAGNQPDNTIKPHLDSLTNLIDEVVDIRNDYKQQLKSVHYDFPQLDFGTMDGVAVEGEDDMNDIYRLTEDYIKNEKVKNTIKAIEGLDPGRIISVLSGNELVKFPLGIVKTIGNTTYTVVFDRAKLLPDHAEVKVYGRVKNDKVDLCFGAEDIKFSYEGGIIGDATLALYGDFAVPLKNDKIGVVFNRFQAQSNGDHLGSYMTFDCNGFVEARLDVDIHLSRDWVLPTDDEGVIIPGSSRVRANVGVTVSSLDDFVAEASLPYFTLTQDTSVAVLVSQATFDFSETKNAPGFNHPLTYNFETGEYDEPPSADEIPLWQGFYMKQIEFILPHVFKNEEDLPLIIGAEEIYIDGKGVSGNAYAVNPLPIDKGRIGESEWAFSIDYVSVGINYNRIIDFAFDGRLNIPLNEETQYLNYDAYAFPSQEFYNLSVGIDSTMSFPVFKAAEVRLSAGTSVSVSVDKGAFVPSAVLCGGMYIKLGDNEEDDKKVKLDMGGVEFHKLLIRDVKPYVGLASNGGSITLKIPPILNNSPITIDHLSLTNVNASKVKLGFGVEVNVSSSDAGGGKTGGSFGIIGEYLDVGGKNKWTYAGVEVQSMHVEIVMGTYLWVSGGLEFFEGDEIWGNGFYGYLNGGVLATDAKEGDLIGPHNEYKVRLQASARFGTKFPDTEEEFKYWAYDFYVSSSDKLFDIYPPVIAKGIGGGVYHHMRMASYNIQQMAEGAGQNPYSGISYEPNRETLFGVKFSLGIGIEEVDGFKGNVTLELSIDQNYALQEIMIYGNCEFVTDLFEVDASSKLASLMKSQEIALVEADDKAKATVQNRITGAMMVYMDFENGFEVQGNFAAYMDAAEGRLKGESNIDMRLSSDDQHFYMGGYEGLVNMDGEPLPDSYVELNVGGFKVTSKFYLCTGNKLPPPPPIPYSIASAFSTSTDANNRGLLPTGGNSLSAGFALGANLAIEIDVTAIFVRFNFDLLAGFDLSLLSNPSSSYCSNVGNTEQGIKGWRAQGNIYGSMNATLETRSLGKWKTRYSQSVRVWLSGDTPRPTYFFIKYQYYNWRGNEKRKEMEYGTKCGTLLKS